MEPQTEASPEAPLEIAPATAGKSVPFIELPLSETMQAALKAADYQVATPIQSGLIPLALEGKDVCGQARTGTGKTAAFSIPIIEQLRSRRSHPGIQAIILVPTRELAVQVREEMVKLSAGRKVNVVAVYGGKPIRGQIEKLQRGAHIVVGTPGRVLDHISRGTLDLAAVWCVVLDEADRMLDIGFRPDIEKILRRCPKERQTLLLSATVPPPIERLAQRYMNRPEKLDFSPKDLSVDTIDQFYFTVEQPRKFDLLLKLLEREDPRQAIVFCRTKRAVDKLRMRLGKKLPGVDCMHGDMAQRVRDRVMKQFRDAEVRILVATDVVGRGIDVSGISHIINFDIPQFCDDYVHRVGRTGRMGREGVAYTFVTPEEGGELTRIEQRINRLLTRDDIPEFSSQAPLVDTTGADGHQPPPQPEPPKPPPAPAHLSGRRTRRHRRAL